MHAGAMCTMLAVNAGAISVDASLGRVVDSNERKPTPILLLPVDGRVPTALGSDVEDSWMCRAGPRSRGTRDVDDPSYRYKRQRNNEAARRSREKRRQQDGVIRHQLEALVVENRELRCQLALLRRLVDKLAAGGSGTLRSAYHHHKDCGGGSLQTGRWSSQSSLSSVAAASDQRTDTVDELLIEDVTASARAETRRKNSDEWMNDASECSGHSEQHQLVTPLNLSQRVYSSSS